MNDHVIFMQNLYALRVAFGITADELAKELGASRQTVSNHERNPEKVPKYWFYAYLGCYSMLADSKEKADILARAHNEKLTVISSGGAHLKDCRVI